MTRTINRTEVSIIGVGYIGLPTAGLLATRGYQVNGIDKNSNLINDLRNGISTINEPGLRAQLAAAIADRKLTFAENPKKSDIFIIAVPTPFKEEKMPDLSAVFSAIDSIIPLLEPGNLVILESTIPVGTTLEVAKRIEIARDDLNLISSIKELGKNSGQPNINRVYLAHCPERVLPGKILTELVENDRIIGGIDVASTELAVNFYNSFVEGNIYSTNSNTAELTKLAENIFRDVNIALANEFSIICEQFGIDVWEMIELANRHPRVNILNPGPGVGGHCIAVDPWFLVSALPNSTKLIKVARIINDEKPLFILEKIRNEISNFPKPRVACLGITYKPNVDDIRQSPALDIVSELVKDANLEIFLVEPNLSSRNNLGFPDNMHLVELEDALNASDIVVLLVGHDEFKNFDHDLLEGKIVIDTIGLWRSK